MLITRVALSALIIDHRPFRADPKPVGSKFENFKMSNPVRIYVLHHPDSTYGSALTDWIYSWFRTSTLEGIPVYVRSHPASGQRVPDDPWTDGEAPPSLDYLIPLVDAAMVRDVAWHDYLERLADGCLPEASGETEGWVMFPVSVDGTSYNLPRNVTHRNFVRFKSPAPSDGGNQPTALSEDTVAPLLKDLTEAMSRDLNSRIFPQQVGQKLKIFISYSRADGADVPKAMRDYILGHTQCDAFFDENAIGYGTNYETVLDANSGSQSRALIVVAGDHYADRPVCRWEIRNFSKPVKVPVGQGSETDRTIHVFHPVVVLNTLSGRMMSRVIPELGQWPTLRWEPGREMEAFSILLRSVLLGARDVLAAKQAANQLSPGVILNRLPGPVALHHLLDEVVDAKGTGGNSAQVHYPGNGLPLMELRLLETTFRNTKLTAFRDVERFLPDELKRSTSHDHQPFDDAVIGISYGSSTELNSLGYLPQHLEETLIYLLRPLLRLGADVMYGGGLPNPLAAKSHTRDMSMTLTNMLNDELSNAGADGLSDVKKAMTPPRLFNPLPWPRTEEVTIEDEAIWIKTRSIIRIQPESPEELRLLKSLEPTSAEHHAYKSYFLSRARKVMAQGFDCPIPGAPHRHVAPAAMIFIGGRTEKFFGCMPGIIEELIYSLMFKRPVFLLGGFGGAAGMVASAACGEGKSRPYGFTTADYQSNVDYPALEKIYKELKVSEKDQPEAKLKWLWSKLLEGRKEGLSTLFRNGLSDEDNRELAQTNDTVTAVHLVWKGLAALIKEKTPSSKKGARRSKGRL